MLGRQALEIGESRSFADDQDQFERCYQGLPILKAIADYEKFCLVYGLKKGLFDLIGESQPISLPDIISKSKLSKRGGEALITVLTALGDFNAEFQIRLKQIHHSRSLFRISEGF